MRKVRILDKAAEEAVKAAVWYEQQRPGLGLEFGHAVNAAFDLLEDEIIPLTKMPGKSGRQGAKKLTLKRFPFNIVVKESPEEIIVVAVAHQSRRPGYWRSRLRA